MKFYPEYLLKKDPVIKKSLNIKEIKKLIKLNKNKNKNKNISYDNNVYIYIKNKDNSCKIIKCWSFNKNEYPINEEEEFIQEIPEDEFSWSMVDLTDEEYLE